MAAAAAAAANVWDVTNLPSFTNSVRTDLEKKENEDYIMTERDDDFNISVELAQIILLSDKLVANDNFTKYGRFIASLTVTSVSRAGAVKFTAVYEGKETEFTRKEQYEKFVREMIDRNIRLPANSSRPLILVQAMLIISYIFDNNIRFTGSKVDEEKALETVKDPVNQLTRVANGVVSLIRRTQ